MVFQSAHDLFKLPTSEAVSLGLRPFDPLELVAVDSDTPSPRIILSYDWCQDGRVVSEISRRSALCTHVFATLLSDVGVPPLSFGFTAACLAEVFEDGQFKSKFDRKKKPTTLSVF